MELPKHFVWTRYGSEAGQSAHAILQRKERERQLAGGVFLWGIGNSIAPSVRALLSATGNANATVVFSPMLSKPKAIDVKPARVVKWLNAVGLDEQSWQMPSGSMVTSRFGAGTQPKRRHYALVCSRQSALEPDELAPMFSVDSLRNFASGNPVGHSQVTSVVSRADGRIYTPNGPYVAALTAALVYPFILELSNPVDLQAPQPLDLGAQDFGNQLRTRKDSEVIRGIQYELIE